MAPRFLASFATTARDPALRRVALAFVAFNVAEWATWIAILVYAYGHGGAVASGFVAIVQLVPAAIFAPLGSELADRYPRVRILTIAYLAQAVAMGATAAALQADAPIAVVYAVAACAATSITLTRPAQNGLLPALATTPERLTGVNAVMSTIENASILIGPALAGLLLSVAGAGFVFALMAAWLALSAFLVAGLRVAGAPARATADRVVDPRQALRLLASEPRALLLIALLAVQAIQVGALDVLFVALAISALGIGDAGVGLLSSAVGLGGIVGAVAAGAVAARGSLPRWMAIGGSVWGGALMLVAPLPQVIVVFALVIAAGAGRGLMDVAGRTLLQRATPPEILSRAFGVLEGLTMAALAVGAALAAILVDRYGVATAVAVVGALLPIALLAVARPMLRRETRPPTPRPLELLRAIPLFAPLPEPTLERLATVLKTIDAPAGTDIVREGDAGDRFYVIDAGQVEVTVDGLVVRRLGPGESFGEIALLRDIPRSATVTAREAVRVYALERDEFLRAARSRPTGGRALEAIGR